MKRWKLHIYKELLYGCKTCTWVKIHPFLTLHNYYCFDDLLCCSSLRFCCTILWGYFLWAHPLVVHLLCVRVILEDLSSFQVIGVSKYTNNCNVVVVTFKSSLEFRGTTVFVPYLIAIFLNYIFKHSLCILNTNL